MKKLGCFILFIILLFTLTACSGELCALPDRLDALYLHRNPISPFDQGQSGQMMNLMSANRVLVTEDALYTLELDEASRPLLASYKLEGERLSEFRVLRQACVPKWLTEHEGRLYYINEQNGDAIECLELESMEHRVLAEGPCAYLQIKGGRLYFTDGQMQLCSMAADGAERVRVLDERCCYPFFIGNVLIYQSEDEGEILKLRFGLGDGVKEIRLTEEAAYAPVIINDRLFYTAGGWIKSMRLDGMAPTLCSGDVVSGAAEYIFENGSWYARAVSTGNGVQQWRCALPEGQAENYPYTGYSYCDFTGGGYRVDADYFADGRLRAFVLYSPDGSRAEYLYGKITNLG